MKRLLFILILIFWVHKCFSQWTQYPVPQNLGRSPSTLVYTNSIKADQGIIFGSFADTAAANALPYLRYNVGTAIWSTSDSSLYVLQKSAFGSYWFKVAGAGGGATGNFWNLTGNFVPVTPAGLGVGHNDPYNALNFKTNALTRLSIPVDGIVRSAGAANKYLMMDTITKEMYYGDAGTGGSYTFPYSVVAPGNAIQLENDTSAAAPGYFYGFNENGRRGFEVPKNIYNSDGTLTGNRTVDFNNNNLNFTTGSGELRINQISAGDYSTAKVQINNQTQFGPYLQVGNLTGNSAANVLYVFFRSNDTATISNIASHKARLFQANRDIVLGEGGVNISDKSGSASNLIFRLRDTVTLLPQGSDLVYGQRSGLVFVKNADYSGRSIVRSGNGGIAFDASAAHLSTVELPHTGGGGGNYYLKGYYAANVGYLYGNNASGDTIENYMGFYSTGSNNQRVLRAYNFFGTGIGPNIDSVWGIYQTQEHYNYLSSRLKIGGSTNRFSPDYNGVADSTLDVRGGAVITGGLKLTGIPYDAGLYSVRIDGSGNISYYDTTTGGGTPAGNFGNVQINRNGAFATPGSDSLDFESATGLTVKGGIRGTTLGVNVAAPTSTYAAQINGDATYTTMLRLNTAESYPRFISMETAFGQNAYFGGTFRGVELVLPLSDGSFAVSRGANNLVNFNLEDGLKVGRRLQTKQGADVASANNVTLGGDGSVFEITGTTTINLIANTNWQNGSEVTLLLENGITVSHNTASSGSNITILLAGAANFTTTAPSVLKLLLSEVGGTQAWREVSRTVFKNINYPANDSNIVIWANKRVRVEKCQMAAGVY